MSDKNVIFESFRRHLAAGVDELTQKELGARTGLSAATISRTLARVDGRITLVQLLDLIDAAGVDRSALGVWWNRALEDARMDPGPFNGKTKETTP